MKFISKRIDGKLVKVRPQPHLTDHAPIDMPFIGELISVHNRSKNTLTHIFQFTHNCVLIGDSTSKFGKWNWYTSKISDCTPVLQSQIP